MSIDPTRRVVENLFTLRRLENGLDRKSRRFLRELFDDLVAQIARRDPTSVVRPTFRERRVRRMIVEISDLVGGRMSEWRSMVRQELAEIGAQQAKWARATLVESLGGPGVMGSAHVSLSKPTGIGPNFFKAIVDSTPFRGETLKDWTTRQTRKTTADVARQVRIGMAQNETIGEIVRRVRGRRSGRGFSGGVWSSTTREAEAVVRTAVTFTADEAHFETYRREDDITTSFEYVATLDSRTTVICASLDGRTWEYDDPAARRPPQHFNCRSTIVPVIDFGGLGIEPPDTLTRAAEGGPVSANTDFQGWLKDQPVSVQEEILGKTRAKLFRENKVALRDMVRRDNTVLTVDQLREKAG